MIVTVHYHAILRERTGLQQEAVELPVNAQAADLLAVCAERSPALRGLVPSLHLAINEEFALPSDPLHDGDRIDLLPPYGGG